MIVKFIRIIALCGATIFLSGCATSSPRRTARDSEVGQTLKPLTEARPEGRVGTNQSGLLARAGAVEVLEFEKTLAIKEVRILRITAAGTNIVSDTIDGDYCGEMRVGVVQIRHGGDPDGKFLVTFQFSNSSTKLQTEYHFFMGAYANPKETYATRTLRLLDSVWTQVYSFKEPESEFRVEVLGGKMFERPGGAKYSLP